MTALLVSPDYVSHYLPMSAVGAALRDDGHEVVFATGDGLLERVLADGFRHVELRLGAGSNPTPEASGDDPGLDEFLAATREGMVSTLELQARRRLHDLLWEPQRVTARLAEIVDDLRPAVVLSDQLAFGAALVAMGAVVQSSQGNISQGQDGVWLLNSLVVVIIGGMGSLLGAVAGSLLFGLVSAFSVTYLPIAGSDCCTQYSPVLTFVLMALVLAFRPQGLFGRAA